MSTVRPLATHTASMMASAADAAPSASAPGPSSFATLLQQQATAPSRAQPDPHAATHHTPEASRTRETQAQPRTSAAGKNEKNKTDGVQAQRAETAAHARGNNSSGEHASDNTVDHDADTSAATAANSATSSSASNGTTTKNTGDHTGDHTGDASASDPLNAWMAMLQGGTQQPALHRAAGAADDGTEAATNGADATLQALDAAGRAQPGLSARDEGRQTLKGRQRNDAGSDTLAFALAGSGRAGDAAGAASATALGLSAVRMLGDGHDGTAGGAALMVSAQTVSTPTAPPTDAAALNALGGLGGLAAAGGSTNVAASDLPGVQTPVGSAGFADELAERVQVFVSKAALESAVGGVHEARLNLNPVEMGPVAIRIVLDGQQAQVDFAAASGATRAALQDSLPALASALDSAGLTLTGGGVSQEFAQTARDQASRDQAGHAALTSGRAALPAEVGHDAALLDASAPAGQWLRHPEGRLDLYA